MLRRPLLPQFPLLFFLFRDLASVHDHSSARGLHLFWVALQGTRAKKERREEREERRDYRKSKREKMSSKDDGRSAFMGHLHHDSWFGGKTIGAFAGVALLINNITGERRKAMGNTAHRLSLSKYSPWKRERTCKRELENRRAWKEEH